MPGRDHIGAARVAAYDYIKRDGTHVHVHGHDSHFHAGGEPMWIILYREQNRVLPGGTKHDQKRAHYGWKAVETHFHSEGVALRYRRVLMYRGYHAIVEKIGAREKMPPIRELERDAERADRRRRVRE